MYAEHGLIALLGQTVQNGHVLPVEHVVAVADTGHHFHDGAAVAAGNHRQILLLDQSVDLCLSCGSIRNISRDRLDHTAIHTAALVEHIDRQQNTGLVVGAGDGNAAAEGIDDTNADGIAAAGAAGILGLALVGPLLRRGRISTAAHGKGQDQHKA